jgi:hypothetical protein
MTRTRSYMSRANRKGLGYGRVTDMNREGANAEVIEAL